MGDGANRVRAGLFGSRSGFRFVFARTAVAVKLEVCGRVCARQAVHTQCEGRPRRTARRRAGFIVNISVLRENTLYLRCSRHCIVPCWLLSASVWAGDAVALLSCRSQTFSQTQTQSRQTDCGFAFRTSFSFRADNGLWTKVVYDFDLTTFVAERDLGIYRSLVSSSAILFCSVLRFRTRC